MSSSPARSLADHMLGLIDVHTISPDATRADADVIITAAIQERATLHAHPATLRALARLVTPYGPMASASSLVERALRVPTVEHPVGWPEGVVVAAR